MGTCIAIVSDMIFATRITSTASMVGANCIVVNSMITLRELLDSEPPSLVIVDMHCEGINHQQAIQIVKSKNPDTTVVAFFSHVQTELSEQAMTAGADDAWPRSVFVQRLPKLLEDSQTHHS